MKILKVIIFFQILFISNSFAYAGLALSSSRVIYKENDKGNSLILANINDYPVVVQTWVDNGDGYFDYAKSPFVVNPPFFKINSKGIQTIKLLHNGSTMQQDRESMFWLNLYEIPGKNENERKILNNSQAKLELAMNTQLKVFYRPKSLKRMYINQIAEKIRFSVGGDGESKNLYCINPTPYYLSFAKIKVKQGDKEYILNDITNLIIPPKGTESINLEMELNLNKPYLIDFSLIDDQGHIFSSSFEIN